MKASLARRFRAWTAPGGISSLPVPLPEDEDRGVGRSDRLNVPPELLHQGVVADELVPFLRLAPQIQVFLGQLVAIQRVPAGQEDAVPAERLFQESNALARFASTAVWTVPCPEIMIGLGGRGGCGSP